MLREIALQQFDLGMEIEKYNAKYGTKFTKNTDFDYPFFQAEYLKIFNQQIDEINHLNRKYRQTNALTNKKEEMTEKYTSRMTKDLNVFEVYQEDNNNKIKEINQNFKELIDLTKEKNKRVKYYIQLEKGYKKLLDSYVNDQNAGLIEKVVDSSHRIAMQARLKEWLYLSPFAIHTHDALLFFNEHVDSWIEYFAYPYNHVYLTKYFKCNFPTEIYHAYLNYCQNTVKTLRMLKDNAIANMLARLKEWEASKGSNANITLEILKSLAKATQGAFNNPIESEFDLDCFTSKHFNSFVRIISTQGDSQQQSSLLELSFFKPENIAYIEKRLSIFQLQVILLNNKQPLIVPKGINRNVIIRMNNNFTQLWKTSFLPFYRDLQLCENFLKESQKLWAELIISDVIEIQDLSIKDMQKVEIKLYKFNNLISLQNKLKLDFEMKKSQNLQPIQHQKISDFLADYQKVLFDLRLNIINHELDALLILSDQLNAEPVRDAIQKDKLLNMLHERVESIREEDMLFINYNMQKKLLKLDEDLKLIFSFRHSKLTIIKMAKNKILNAREIKCLLDLLAGKITNNAELLQAFISYLALYIDDMVLVFKHLFKHSCFIHSELDITEHCKKIIWYLDVLTLIKPDAVKNILDNKISKLGLYYLQFMVKYDAQQDLESKLPQLKQMEYLLIQYGVNYKLGISNLSSEIQTIQMQKAIIPKINHAKVLINALGNQVLYQRNKKDQDKIVEIKKQFLPASNSKIAEDAIRYLVEHPDKSLSDFSATLLPSDKKIIGMGEKQDRKKQREIMVLAKASSHKINFQSSFWRNSDEILGLQRKTKEDLPELKKGGIKKLPFSKTYCI